MGQPHKHAGLIKAWADGAEVEFDFNGEWRGCPTPTWIPSTVYRIKPDPFKTFKAALSEGERVDAREKGQHQSGFGWTELEPGYDEWSPLFEYRVARAWQDERDAFDRGEQIQRRWRNGAWGDVSTPIWSGTQGLEYRVKPQPKIEDFVVVTIAQFVPEEPVNLNNSAEFSMPTITLAIAHCDGRISDISIKEWTQ